MQVLVCLENGVACATDDGRAVKMFAEALGMGYHHGKAFFGGMLMDERKRKGFKRYASSMFNVSRWVGTEEIRESYRSLRSMVSSFCTIDQPEYEESFEEAMIRLSLTTEDLEARRKYYLWFAFFYLMIAVGLAAYAYYLYGEGQPMAGTVCLPLVMVMLVFFFKYHFWYTQIKHKRLGMGVSQWLVALLTGVVK